MYVNYVYGQRNPPFDLCVAHLGKRQYWNSTTNSWCVPSRETNSHYCACVSSILYSFPEFNSSYLVVPEDVSLKLSEVYLKIL